jgi:2-oxoglutarate dehydrogenase E2 component (dihydrolipoamide succinyltransferase)
MARTEVVMPQMGESITTGTITKWHKNPGDMIKLDEILLEISTDKVESEIPSPVAGKIVEILFPEGATIDVGKTIAVIDDDAKASVSSTPAAKKVEPIKTPEVTVSTPKVEEEVVVHSDGSRRFYTPLVKAMAKEQGISLEELKNISGSGSAGRVNKDDLLKYISLRTTKPQGATKPMPQASTLPVGGVAQTRSSGERVEIIPMDNMRKAIAKNMLASKLTSPHVNSIDEIDMTNLVKFREKFKETFKKQEGFNLTYTPFILRALILALKEHPLVNASIEGDNIVVKKDINIGCAVAVPGNGLVVPVIKNADSLNMTGLCRVLNDLANKARAKKLTMDDLSGGTFTFTNVGSFGTLLATPVILQPQLGIFAAGVIKKRVMVTEDDAIAIRSMMYGTHTYDHRLVDGELGGKFLASAKFHLENIKPETLF